MKLIGALFVVASAFALGALLRAGKLREEKILRTLLAFLKDLRDNIEFKTNALRDVVAHCALNDRYAMLDFLPDTLSRLDAGANLKNALCAAYEHSECAARLDEGDARELTQLFGCMGGEIDEIVLQSIGYTCARLEESISAKAEQNKKQKGYYESLFALAGAAVAIMLV